MSLQKSLRSLVRPKGVTIEIPSQPHFDSEATIAWFTKRLEAARLYVEFGSGGSTVLASALGKEFVSIESDRDFLAAVAKKIEQAGHRDPAKQHLVWRDIGQTKALGKPFVVGVPLPARRKLFRAYSDLPITELGGRLPDLVLVDGRFRAACALKALRALAPTSGWTLIVDDYVGRPHFHVVEEFAVLKEHVGRMAVFEAAKPWDAEALARAIAKTELDYR